LAAGYTAKKKREAAYRAFAGRREMDYFLIRQNLSKIRLDSFVFLCDFICVYVSAVYNPPFKIVLGKP